MLEVELSILGLVLAVVSNMVIGFVWYAKPVFGATWQKLVGLSDKELAKDSTTPMVAAPILALVQAYVLSHVIAYSQFANPDYSDLTAGLSTGFWVWLGFVLPTMGVGYLFSRRRKKLLAIDVMYHLVALLVMGAVLATVR